MTVLSPLSCDLVVADWDETITANDTIALLAQTAYNNNPCLCPRWDYYVDSYNNDYTAFEEGFGKIRTLDDQIRFFQGLENIEDASVRRIEAGHVFEGVPEQNIAQSGPVEYRAGWWKFAGLLKKRHIPLIILSVNWSAAFISWAFTQNGFTNVPIYSNEFEVGDNGRLTGKFEGHLRTAIDKQEQFNKIRDENKGKKICYFGDSSTDLLTLLQADTGYVVAKRSTFDKFARLNISTDTIGFVPDFQSFL